MIAAITPLYHRPAKGEEIIMSLEFGKMKVATPVKTKSVAELIADAKESYQSCYVEPGLYPLLYIEALKFVVSRKNDTIFIAEFLILSSEVGSRPAGSRMSWACNLRHDASPGNIKGFLAAVLGTTAEGITEDLVEKCISSENPCEGRLVFAQARQVPKKDGSPFTVVRWAAVDEDTQADAQALATEAGLIV
jgi:hypothetical protein